MLGLAIVSRSSVDPIARERSGRRRGSSGMATRAICAPGRDADPGEGLGLGLLEGLGEALIEDETEGDALIELEIEVDGLGEAEIELIASRIAR